MKPTRPRSEGDSPRDTIAHGTQRLFDELQFGASPFTNSASDLASAPVTPDNGSAGKQISRRRKPRSPQSAAHQSEYHKRWSKTPKGLASLTAAGKRWRERYPERIKAHRMVGYALRQKRLVKGPCELAGADCRGRIEAHHDDYSKPLEVRWVCRGHHERLDRERHCP